MSFFSFPSKKGQNLSMSFIVTAAIALVVMAVVIMIFVTKSNKSSDGFGSCEMSNGLCVQGDTCIGKDGVYPQRIVGKECPLDASNNEQTCCLLKPPED